MIKYVSKIYWHNKTFQLSESSSWQYAAFLSFKSVPISQEPGSQMSIVFKYPPINEVVISTYFNPTLSDLRNEHVGLFWGKIKKEFPVVRQQLPIEKATSSAIVLDVTANEPFPMPRYWFVADDEINLIQVQKNAFMFNWRRRDNEYPRYHKIKPKFDKYYDRFSEFIRSEIKLPDPSIDLCELTYVNILERCDYWTGPQDTKNVIPLFPVPKINDNEFSGFNCNYAYKVLNDLHLNISIRSGIRTQQKDVPVLLFEIRANGLLGRVAKSAADEWFENAHDAIIGCFLDLTSEDIRNQFWKPLEDGS